VLYFQVRFSIYNGADIADISYIVAIANDNGWMKYEGQKPVVIYYDFKGQYFGSLGYSKGPA